MGYLIEVKAWSGRIRGNDAQWELPPLAGDKSTFRACPLSLIEQKSKALASLLRDGDTPLKNVFIAPMIVLVSKDEPDLKGRCADATVSFMRRVPGCSQIPARTRRSRRLCLRTRSRGSWPC